MSVKIYFRKRIRPFGHCYGEIGGEKGIIKDNAIIPTFVAWAIR